MPEPLVTSPADRDGQARQWQDGAEAASFVKTTCALPNGVRLALTGAGSGPALFLLHGIGGAGIQWSPQIATLRKHYGVIAWDARGYGRSSGPPVARFEDFVDDLFAVFDALAIDRALVVGHSMGGRILLEAARRDQARFAAMVLSGTQAAYLAHMTSQERHAYVAKRHALFETGGPTEDAARRVAESVLAPNAGKEVEDALVARFMELRPEGFLAALNTSAGMDASDVLGRLTVPTEVIGGMLDPVCPIEETRRIAQAIGQRPAVALAGVAHMPNIEAPARFAEIVADFAARHETAAILIDVNRLHSPAHP